MGLKLDGISTNGNMDSSGETLVIKGHDITDLLDGKGVINWEHEKGAEDIIGAIIYAKKINSADDCETERQKMFYDLSGGPYVYIIGELFEDEEHPGAVACAAMVRYYHKRKEKMFIGWSIEGQTLVRKGNSLERSVGRRVAFTLRPCNKSALMGVFEDSKVQQAVKKSEQESNIRSFEVESVIVDDPILEIRMAAEQLAKTLVAGNYNAAPSTLTAGSALQVEDRTMKNRVKAAVRDWDRKRPLKEVIKAALPGISEDYVDHFTHIAEDLSLKKGIKPPARIGSQHSSNRHQSDDQKKLVDGLYMDIAKPIRMENPLGGESRFKQFRLKNDAGQEVFVKEPHLRPDESEASHRATAYYQAARDVFGMGDHVPVTNHFQHPKGEAGRDGAESWQAQEFLKGSKLAHGQAYSKAVQNGRKEGWLPKLIAMDMIMGHGDRHLGNVLVHNGKLMHIDNDDAFDYNGPMPHQHPESESDLSQEKLDPATMEWLQGIKARDLATSMAKSGLKADKIKQAAFALKAMQQYGHKYPMAELQRAITSQRKAVP